MISYTELRAAVAGQIRIAATDTDMSRWQLDEGINQAQRFIITTMPLEFLNEAIKTAWTKTIAGEYDYEWPGDFVRMVNLWIKYRTTDEWIPLREVVGRIADNNNSMFGQSMPDYPIVQPNAERGFYVYPTPTIQILRGIRMRYVYHLPVVKASQDCMLDLKWKNLMVLKAVAYCLLVDGRNPELAVKFENMVNAEVALWKPRTEDSAK